MGIIIVFCHRHPRIGMNSLNRNRNYSLIWMHLKKIFLLLKIEQMLMNSLRHWMIVKWMDVQMLMLRILLTGLLMALLRGLRMQKIRLTGDRMNYSCYNCHWHYCGSRYLNYSWNYCNYYNYSHYE